LRQDSASDTDEVLLLMPWGDIQWVVAYLGVMKTKEWEKVKRERIGTGQTLMATPSLSVLQQWPKVE
jgi:hypothetical protein